MEQTAQTFFQTNLVIPALLAIIPILLLVGGYRLSHKRQLPVAGRSLYWLAGHAVTLVIVVALTLLSGRYVPEQIILHLPLFFTLVYLGLGFVYRSVFLFTLGLSTVGLWYLVVAIAGAMAFPKIDMYLLPQEPFWYLLAAAVTFGLRYMPKPRKFWEDAESALVTISSCYLMGGLWLLALGKQSLLAGVGLPQYLWATVLLIVALFLLWCAKYMRDPLLAACSATGVADGVYTFISAYPWQVGGAA